VGKKPVSGKSKGGIKAHVMINASEMLPELVWFTSAAASDVPILDKIPYKKDAVYVFDKGYIDYLRWEKITLAGGYFVTRLKDNAVYESLQELDITDDVHSGILKDEIIELPVRENGRVIRGIKFRRVAFWDEKENRLLLFVTNMLEVKSDQIADIYKQRWQIETLFRSLKQNFPLKYFLGDNENAIIIQIWAALIANLLLRIINERITRTWAYSNLVSFTRIHLFNFINLISFLNDPEKDWETEYHNQLSLFPT
jgi:IS4 transposase